MQYHFLDTSLDSNATCCSSPKSDRQLLLFFHGWSGHLGMLSHLKFKQGDNLDVMIIYNYQSLTLPCDVTKIISTYSNIHLVAWSFGVWVANAVCVHHTIKCASSVAYNGSLFPIHNQYGIPTRIAKATLKTLNEKNWLQFLEQMTIGLAPDYAKKFHNKEHLLEHKQSLAFLYQSFETPIEGNLFNRAIIGNNDVIIPTAAQKKSWDKLHTPYQLINAPHYPFINYNDWRELLE